MSATTSLAELGRVAKGCKCRYAVGEGQPEGAPDLKTTEPTPQHHTTKPVATVNSKCGVVATSVYPSVARRNKTSRRKQAHNLYQYYHKRHMDTASHLLHPRLVNTSIGASKKQDSARELGLSTQISLNGDNIYIYYNTCRCLLAGQLTSEARLSASVSLNCFRSKGRGAEERLHI
jgi:hypothetical protein